MVNEEFFKINVSGYVDGAEFVVYRPASINSPKSNSVMFITEEYITYADVLLSVDNCLVFWPENVKVPEDIASKHAIVLCKNPRFQYSKFYRENNIKNLPQIEDMKIINGAYISVNAVIKNNPQIFPGVYIGGEVVIGDNVYIGYGAKIVGNVCIGNDVVIRENAVIGADGLTTERDENGSIVIMPQFGGVVLEDGVQIGANTVIARGAIDNTIIRKGCKIDNSCFISHNVIMGNDSLMVGESIMFGSASTGEQAYISGNATVRNGIHIGNKALVGMGAVVVKNVPDGVIVKGNPAK